MYTRPVSLTNIPIAYCFARRDSRKVSGKHQSQFHLEDEQGSSFFSFEIEHNPNKGYPCGGFSKWVKKGFLLSDGKQVAVKRSNIQMSQGLALDYAIRASTFIQVMGDVAVPFVSDKGVYLLMEFFEGRVLSAFSADVTNTLELKPVKDRLKYVVDILTQLASLHDLDCVHRDIKPCNIMIGKDSAKLIDLDGAFMEGEVTLLQSFTVPFLSHENQMLYIQYGKELRTEELFSKKSDIYALGLTLCILYSYLFKVSNYPRVSKSWDGTSVIQVEKRDRARFSDNALASFFISLLKRDCRYRSAREVLTEFVKLCQSEYNKDFSAALKPNGSMTKQNLKAVLDAVPAVRRNVSSAQSAYQRSVAYLKHSLIQPKASIELDILFSGEAERALIEIEPRHYQQVFNNISSATSKTKPVAQLVQLYSSVFTQLADERKFDFLYACLQKLVAILPPKSQWVRTFWSEVVNHLGTVEPSANNIIGLIKMAKTKGHDLQADIMVRFYESVMHSEESVHAIFNLLSNDDKATIYQLYLSKFYLSPKNKLTLLRQLTASQRCEEMGSELRKKTESREQVEVILWYLQAEILDIQAFFHVAHIPVLGKLSEQDFSFVINKLIEKIPLENHLNDYILTFISELSIVNAAAANKFFNDYFIPSALRLSQVMTPAQVEVLEHSLVPRNKEEMLAMVRFFGAMNNFPAVTRKLQYLPLSSEEKVTLAMDIDVQVVVAFCANHLSSEDIRDNNLIMLLHRLPVNNKLSFLLQHIDKVKSLVSVMSDETAAEFQALCLEIRESVTVDTLHPFMSLLLPAERFSFIVSRLDLINIDIDLRPMMDDLDDVHYLFLAARQQIMKRLNAYVSEKSNLHDRRVAFIYDKVSHAQSLQELAAVINGNGFDAEPGHRYQFENRPPKHKLFSYGFSGLLKSCMAIIEKLPEPLEKDAESGFYLFRET